MKRPQFTTARQVKRSLEDIASRLDDLTDLAESFLALTRQANTSAKQANEHALAARLESEKNTRAIADLTVQVRRLAHPSVNGTEVTPESAEQA